MKKLLLLNTLLLSFSFAQQEPYCELQTTTAERKVKLPAAPSWFISVHPDGDKAAVIMSGLGGNNIVSLDEVDDEGLPKTMRVPGGVDPVYTPDGWFLSEPGTFYDNDKLEDNFKNNKNSKGMEATGRVPVSSVYQSIGVTNKSANEHDYMYIADPNPVENGNLQFAIVRGTKDRRTNEKKISTVKTGTLCANNPDFRAHTPMISRDGKYLSVINDKTNTTQIFRVGADGSECKLVVDIGVPTGKVSFDFSETTPRKLAFHVDRYSTNIGWFQEPGSNLSKDSYVMTLDVEGKGDNEVWKPKTIQKLSHNAKKGTGVYYPRFTRDGKIVAVNDTGDDYFLERYDPNTGVDFEYNELAFSDLNSNSFHCSPQESDQLKALYGLASLYAKICDKSYSSVRMKDAILIQPFLDQDACKQLVEEYWENTKSTLSAEKANAKIIDSSTFDLSYEDVLAVCPEKKSKTAVETVVVDNRVNEETPEDAFKAVCSGCHLPAHPSGGFMFINDSGAINTKSIGGHSGLNANTAERSLNTILNPQSLNPMPPSASDGHAGYEMDPIRKEKVVKYLMDFLPEAKRRAYQDKLNQHLGR